MKYKNWYEYQDGKTNNRVIMQIINTCNVVRGLQSKPLSYQLYQGFLFSSGSYFPEF